MKKNLFFILLTMLFHSAFTQNGNWKQIKRNDIVTYTLQFIAGAADGTNQAILHHGLGAGNEFWDQTVSWKNKYRDFDNGDTRAAFPGSKGIFVAFTDGFHLTRFIDRSCTLATVVISFGDLKDYPKKDRWKVILKKALICSAANRAGFFLTYDVLFKK